MEKVMAEAKLVKEIRNITQAGFLDCQKALDSTNENMEEAIKILIEKDFSLLPGAYIEIKEDEKRSESEIKSELKKIFQN